MGIALEGKGNHAEAIEAIRRSRHLAGDEGLASALGDGYARGGYRGALEAWAANWEEAARQGRQVQWVSVAMLYARLGDKERALACLDKAFEERSRALAYLAVEPQLDPVRAEPRFQEMLRRMGLSSSAR